jgi:hypothetical protein
MQAAVLITGTAKPIEFILRKLGALILQAPILGRGRLLERRRGLRSLYGRAREQCCGCRQSVSNPPLVYRSSTVGRLSLEHHAERSIMPTIVFASPEGGAGTSTFAAVLATELAGQGKGQ